MCRSSGYLYKFPADKKLVNGVKYKYVVDGLPCWSPGPDIHQERANAGQIVRLFLDARERLSYYCVYKCEELLTYPRKGRR